MSVDIYNFIYKTISPSGRYYIGRHTTKNLQDGYLGSGKWVNSYKNKSNLKRVILEFAEDFETLLELEENHINNSIDDPLNMNYNNKPVGFGSGKHNPNTDPKRKKFLTERMMGVKNPMYGKTHNEETKRKISESTSGENNPFYGKSHTIETRNKIKETSTGRKLTEETKKKLSEIKKGKETWNKGLEGCFEMPESGKQAISKSWKDRPKLECENCGESFYPNTYKRWHGDNCKNAKL